MPLITIALLERDLPVVLAVLTAIDLEGAGLVGKGREGAGLVEKGREGAGLVGKVLEGAGLVGGEEGNLSVRVLCRQKETAGTTGPHTSTNVIPRGFPLR